LDRKLAHHITHIEQPQAGRIWRVALVIDLWVGFCKRRKGDAVPRRGNPTGGFHIGHIGCQLERIYPIGELQPISRRHVLRQAVGGRIDPKRTVAFLLKEIFCRWLSLGIHGCRRSKIQRKPVHGDQIDEPRNKDQ
jgi:hypothetical protein